MRWNAHLVAPGVASVLILIGGLALAQNPGGMMARGTPDGDARTEASDGGMQGCVQMMQGMRQGGSPRPNEQWRHQQ